MCQRTAGSWHHFLLYFLVLCCHWLFYVIFCHLEARNCTRFGYCCEISNSFAESCVCNEINSIRKRSRQESEMMGCLARDMLGKWCEAPSVRVTLYRWYYGKSITTTDAIVSDGLIIGPLQIWRLKEITRRVIVVKKPAIRWSELRFTIAGLFPGHFAGRLLICSWASHRLTFLPFITKTKSSTRNSRGHDCKTRKKMNQRLRCIAICAGRLVRIIYYKSRKILSARWILMYVCKSIIAAPFSADPIRSFLLWSRLCVRFQLQFCSCSEKRGKIPSALHSSVAMWGVL